MWLKKVIKRKITFKFGNSEPEIDFVLVNKKNIKYLKDIHLL